jgi:hypothetical protein
MSEVWRGAGGRKGVRSGGWGDSAACTEFHRLELHHGTSAPRKRRDTEERS